MRTLLGSWTKRGDAQGIIMAAAMVIAGGFDALVNIASGRLLPKEQFAIFVAVTALLQILVHLTNVIRNVVAYYIAGFTAATHSMDLIRSFYRQAWRWAWLWGSVGTAIMFALAPFIARFMNIPSAWPLRAASLALLMLFVRPVTDGALQGIQNFIGLGSVQILQSSLRLLFAIVLILLGLQAAGAILALPLATTAALVIALLFLRPVRQAPGSAVQLPKVSLGYSLYTLLGLLSFAILVNVDAIAVKRFFDDATAGDYGTVVTLGKINLFATFGIAMVLFPKATQRVAEGREANSVLWMALGATVLVGAMATLIFFLIPGQLVTWIFSGQYTDPGIVLGLVGIATTLYAGVNIWLNYALSLKRNRFIYALALIVAFVIAAMTLINGEIVYIVMIMIAGGLAGNLAGAFTTLSPLS